MLREMRTLLQITGNGLRFLFLLLLRCPFEAAHTIVNALFLQNAFQAVAENDHKRLTMVCLLFGLASLLIFLYNGTVWSIYAPFVTRMEGKLRSKLFTKISAFSYEQMESLPQSEWVTRFNVDIQMPFSRPLHLPHAACAIVNICVSAGILWLTSPEIFGLVLLFVVPQILVNQLLIARAMPKLNQNALEATGKNAGELVTLIRCTTIAALSDSQSYFMKRFENSSLSLRTANMKIRKRSLWSAATTPLLGLGGYLVLLLISSEWIKTGIFTFGELTAAFQLRSGLLIGVMMLVNSLISIHASMAGIRRLNQTMVMENSLKQIERK